MSTPRLTIPSYNSAIFSSASAIEFVSIIATNEFFNTTQFNHSYVATIASKFVDPGNLTTFVDELHDDVATTNLQVLAEEDCDNALGAYYMTTYAAIIQIVSTNLTERSLSDVTQNSFILTTTVADTPKNGINLCCSYFHQQFCTSVDFAELPDLGQQLVSNASCYKLYKDSLYSENQFDTNTEMLVTNYTILKRDRCLAKPAAKQNCTVQFIPEVLWTVVVCNIVKIICFLALLKLPFEPLITLGDAIESFLSDPDETTKDLGAFPHAQDLNFDSVKDEVFRAYLKSIGKWTTTRKLYFRAASCESWSLIIML